MSRCDHDLILTVTVDRSKAFRRIISSFFRAGWLAVAAIFLSAVGLYYYLLILKQALVAAPVGST